jgi:hypothetical protein
MSTNIDDAVQALKHLSEEEQAIAAEAIMDFAESANELRLSPAQIEEVKKRLADKRSVSLTIEEVRERLTILGA